MFFDFSSIPVVALNIFSFSPPFYLSFFIHGAVSRLFFKQCTSWRPHISRDIMISVASEMSRDSPGPNTAVFQLPVQVFSHSAYSVDLNI